jgi:hypothetical protein
MVTVDGTATVDQREDLARYLVDSGRVIPGLSAERAVARRGRLPATELPVPGREH